MKEETIQLKDIQIFNSDEIENMRRMASRGLMRAQLEKQGAYIDMFQHILDCYSRVFK